MVQNNHHLFGSWCCESAVRAELSWVVLWFLAGLSLESVVGKSLIKCCFIHVSAGWLVVGLSVSRTLSPSPASSGLFAPG